MLTVLHCKGGNFGFMLRVAVFSANVLFALVAWRPAFTMAQCLPISLGCSPSELVLRGGLLPKPVILTNVKFIGDKPFLHLWKGHPAICKFLTGVSSCRRPLSNSSVFEALQKLKNVKFQDLVKQARDGHTEPESQDAVDFVDQLGLDAPEAKASPTKSRRAVSASRLLAQLPSFASVAYDHQDGWEPMLLMEAASKAPAIEATAENMQMLFNLVASELAVGTTKETKLGVDAPGPRRAPRGPAGARQYFIRNRWVTKIKSLEDGAAPRPPYARRFRTLKRRASDDVSDVEPKKPNKQANRRSGARKTSSVIAAAAEADDCLSMV